MIERTARNEQAWREEHGQATVEYALVLLAFVAAIGALGALWHAGRDGSLQRLATRAASHTLSAERAIASAKDLLLY